MNHFGRREFIHWGAATIGVAFAFPGQRRAAADGLALPSNPWDRGDLAHLLPMVNHKRLLIKASFTRPLHERPHLQLGGHATAGRPSDTHGRFWQFDVTGLEAAREYELQLVGASGSALCDPWPLKTFPGPNAEPEHLRLLVYTCAGGNESIHLPNGVPFFRSLAERQRLLERGLSFAPDVAIGLGDQVYWDQVTGLAIRNPAIRNVIAQTYDAYGHFDRTQPVLGTVNEDVFTRVVDAQLAQLYGVRFRSIPTYLTQDDHDYFENDVANDTFISFPPDPFMLRLARATQHLYFPEFLPDDTRPLGLGGSAAADRAPGLSECYGTLRYGKLLEALMYDCRRFVTLKGPTAGFVTREAEAWLAKRTAAEQDTRHLLHMPSTPFGWSAGKWGEWYPDLLEASGRLGTTHPKPYWQAGWFAQHQRLVGAIAAQQNRIPIAVSGDLHALGAGQIVRSGNLDLQESPVTTILSGPISTAGPGWPSMFRGTGPQVPTDLRVDESLAPIEKNGFSIIDVTRDSITVRQFAWRPPEPIEAIDTLEAIHTLTLSRRI